MRLVLKTASSNVALPAPPSPLFLDNYPGAKLAFSVARKLKSTYAGSCIRVRRSSDNTEQTIGFVNDALDTTALLAFVGAGTGYVSTVYDQSGNGFNAVQTTQANQPVIVSSGVLQTANGKPSMLFNGTTNHLFIAANAAFSDLSNYTFISVAKITNIATTRLLLHRGSQVNTSGQRNTLLDFLGGGQCRFVMFEAGGGTPIATCSNQSNVLAVFVGSNRGSDIVGYSNKTTISGSIAAGASETGTLPIYIGARVNTAYFIGNVSEVFYYSQGYSNTDIANVSDSINSYYSLY